MMLLFAISNFIVSAVFSAPTVTTPGIQVVVDQIEKDLQAINTLSKENDADRHTVSRRSSRESREISRKSRKPNGRRMSIPDIIFMRTEDQFPSRISNDVTSMLAEVTSRRITRDPSKRRFFKDFADFVKNGLLE